MTHQAQHLIFADNSRLSAFLSKNNIQDYTAAPIGEDMAPRRYYRLAVKGRDAAVILCLSPADSAPDAHPGHLIVNTVKLSRHLAAQGVRVPQVYDADGDAGFVLLEDFGDVRFDQAIASGQIDAADAYRLAAQASKNIQRIADIDTLPDYYKSHVHKARGRVVEWYLPILLKQHSSSQHVDEYLALWDKLEDSLLPQRQVFAHVDFHLMNLMYLPHENGTDQCGVLDFQGAMRAPYVYDLVNLLGDARRVVAPDIKAKAKADFTTDMSAGEKGDFDNHYAVLSAQFHGRCLGQFIQLAFLGKPQYIQYIPVLLQQFKDDMNTPILAPIKSWLSAQGMDFDTPAVLNMTTDRQFVAHLL
jgi:aminoglycoside/choline kinase family phosphotransferase